MKPLSCDSLEDAIRSLAMVYQVTPFEIHDLYENKWPDLFSSDTCFWEFKENRSLACSMSQYLPGKKFDGTCFKAAFYHRTRFDGTAEWFHEGLLNAPDGVDAFLVKIRPYATELEQFERVVSKAKSYVYERNSLEGTNGPHAFDLLEHAKGADSSGLDYDFPEVFNDPSWEKSGTAKARDELIEVLTVRLKPVIVKFLDTPLDMDLYINHLWLFLQVCRYGLEYDDPMIYSFCGHGRTVSSNRIVELITDF